MNQGPTYWDYLRLDNLLGLQSGLEADDDDLNSDELHFIVVHQVYELWFKLILRELREARNHLGAPKLPEDHVPAVVHHLGRVAEILKLAVNQWSVMETLTPQGFLGFRDKLSPASGFQSFQMREIEILLGSQSRLSYGDVDPVQHIIEKAKGSPGGELAVQRLENVQAEPSLRDTLHDWLFRTPIQGSSPQDDDDDNVVQEFLGAYETAHQRVQDKQRARLVEFGIASEEALEQRFAATAQSAREFLFAEDFEEAQRARVRRVRAALLFIESYRNLPLLAWPRLLVDSVVEVEEQFVLWRNRHARMTERTIGRRVGTGGSSGVDYLDRAAQGRTFPELWGVRTLLLPVDELPELQNPQFYGFAV